MATSEIETFRRIVNNPHALSAMQNTHKADLLPLLFRLRGQPYSLQDHIQFREMYSANSAPDTIFMCGRQLGKSINLSRSEILDLLTVPHLQLLFVAPLQSQTMRYSTLYLREAISSCALAVALQSAETEGLSDSTIVKAVHHQSFSHGSGIQLTYAKTSSDRARGIFADRIDFDEIQDQLVDNIPIISESLTASDWGFRRFTGTAKTTDNTIEALWQDSSMCEWVMPCDCISGEAGRYWNIPTLDGKVLDMIQVDGVHCVNCGNKIDVRKGEWVPTYRDRYDTFRGFHIPQIVVPYITESPERWSALIRKVLRLPLPIILQEILGISCSLGARIITQADIDKVSVLPGVKALQEKQQDYMFTVGGVDWGVAEHDSFTVHTIIGVRPDGKIDTLWARRFIGFDPDELLMEIAKSHRFYNCKILAGDFGMGFDKNILLEKEYGLAVVQIMYVRQNRLLGYNPFQGHHRWTVDKTTALELMFLAIKYERIRFPPKDQFDNFTKDLLSPYEEIVESGGMTNRRFLRNPNWPDDFCHALCFASLVAMRLMNNSIVDLVPSGVMAMAKDDAAPDMVDVDPAEILAALNV